MISLDEGLWLAAIVIVASMLQAATGFGFSIIGTPFLLLLYPADIAIQINMILSLVLSALMLKKAGKAMDKGLLLRLIQGSGVGVVLGLMLFLSMSMRTLTLFVGVLILLLTVLLMIRLRIRSTPAGDRVAGGLSGVLTSSIGVPGPPLLLYFTGSRLEKSVLRSTTLIYNLFVYSISLALQIGFAGTSKEAWLGSAISLLPLFLGILLGQWLFTKISQKVFRVLTFLLLLTTGGYLLISS